MVSLSTTCRLPDNEANADIACIVTDANGRTESYTYDAGGRLIERRDPDGTMTVFAYNGMGRLSELRDGVGHLLVRYGYDIAGRLIQTDMGNGASTTYKYDAAGQITQILNLASDGSIANRLIYTFDEDSRAVGASTLDGDWTYDYDAAGQITGVEDARADLAGRP